MGGVGVGPSGVEGMLGVLFVVLTLTTVVICFMTSSFGVFVCMYNTTVFIGLVRFFVQFAGEWKRDWRGSGVRSNGSAYRVIGLGLVGRGGVGL